MRKIFSVSAAAALALGALAACGNDDDGNVFDDPGGFDAPFDDDDAIDDGGTLDDGNFEDPFEDDFDDDFEDPTDGG